MKYLAAFLFAFIFLHLGAIQTRGLAFIQEELVFHLDGKAFTLDGDYWFCNNTDETVSQVMYFPIPSDSTHQWAEHIKVKMLKPLQGQQASLLDSDPQSMVFRVTLPARTIGVCRISYRQKLSGNTAKYVLLTTQSWGKPLEIAKYTLITHKRLQVIQTSLPDPIIKTKGGKRIYTWGYINFMPEQDFSVTFR